MVLPVTILGLIVTLILVVFSTHKNRVNRFLATYYFILALYGLVHHFVMNSESVFWTAVTYINISFLFLLPGPFLFFYIRGLMTDQKNIIKKDWVHFIPSFISFLCISPWIFNDFHTKEVLAREIIGNPNIIFTDNYLPFSIPPLFNFCLRSISGIGYSLYCLKYIYNYHEKNGFSIKYQQLNTQWIYLFVCFQLIFFIIYLINTLIAYSDSIETILYGRGSFFYITQGMFFMIQLFAILLYWIVLFRLPKKLSVKSANQSSLSEA